MKIDIVTPWFPDYGAPFLGSFVKEQAEALIDDGHSVSVEVLRLFASPRGPVRPAVYDSIERIASNNPDRIFQSDGYTTWVPTPVPSGSGQQGRVEAFSKMLALKRRHLPTKGDVVHAHLGVPTGAALLDLSDTPLIVTEHQSTLDRIFAERDARAAYQQVIERSTIFLVVSDHLRSSIYDEFECDFSSKIRVMPNIVNCSAIEFKRRNDNAFINWIYVGGILEHKGIRLLIKSFILYKKQLEKNATLTIVGDGPMRAWVERQARINGIANSVIITGAVPSDKVPNHLSEADVMVHMSRYETFGLASLEGIAAGLPVVSLANGGAQGTWGPIEGTAGKILDLDSAPDDVVRAVHQLKGSQGLDSLHARSFVEEKFSQHTVRRLLLETYQESIGMS